jgi:hypothetical protein
MLLKRLPDAVDANPAKIAFGIVKIVLQIKDVGRYSSYHCLTNAVWMSGSERKYRHGRPTDSIDSGSTSHCGGSTGWLATG